MRARTPYGENSYTLWRKRLRPMERLRFLHRVFGVGRPAVRGQCSEMQKKHSPSHIKDNQLDYCVLRSESHNLKLHKRFTNVVSRCVA